MSALMKLGVLVRALGLDLGVSRLVGFRVAFAIGFRVGE